MHFQLAQEIDRMRKRIKKTWVFFSAFEDSESKTQEDPDPRMKVKWCKKLNNKLWLILVAFVKL